MAACYDLMKGLDLRCKKSYPHKFYQELVLINKDDIHQWTINRGQTNNNASFELHSGLTGFRFLSSQEKEFVSGSFTMSEQNNIPVYDHKIEMVVSGVSESEMTLLKQLDVSDFVGALQHNNGEVIIYGLNYGLKTTGYTYEPQSGIGGAVISLESNMPEYDPPYRYNGNPSDFDNGFKDIILNFAEFNNDFNDDFNTV